MVQSAVRRPKVFVSSTIRDFGDLRQSLRYFLELAGYDVQVSEYTDFDRDPGPDVFDSCFSNIRSSDFYVLLIGSEVGSRYDEEGRVSVTRQEFRVALESERARALGICVFVRSTVDVAIRQWEQDGRPPSGSRYVTNPNFTADFLAEARASTSGGRAARWVYTFSDFRDIANALQVLLRISTNFERRLLEENLLEEILFDLSLMSTKGARTSIQSNHGWATHVRDEITIGESQLDGTIRLTPKQLGRLGFMFFAKPRVELRHQIMDEAISRGLFLSFDPQTGQLEQTVEHQALAQLRDDISDFESSRDSEYQKLADEEFLVWARKANSGQLPAGADVNVSNLALIIGLHDRLDNIYKASAQFAKWLCEASDEPAVERRAQSPIEGMSEKIEAERVSPDEMRWALSEHVFPFGERLTPGTREIAANAEASYVQGLRSLIPDSVASDEDLYAMVRDTLDSFVLEPYEPPQPTERRARRR
jgi:hypothetical protein